MIHPDYEILEEKDEENLLNFKRIVPVYSETEGLHQKYIRKVMNFALENYSRYIASPIPMEICRQAQSDQYSRSHAERSFSRSRRTDGSIDQCPF